MASFRLSLSVSLLRKFHCANLLSPILMQGTRDSQRERKALGVSLSHMRAASRSANCFGRGLENISKKAVLNSSSVVSLSGLNMNCCSCSRLRVLIMQANWYCSLMWVPSYATRNMRAHSWNIVWVSLIRHISPLLACGLKIMAGAEAVARAAALVAAVTLPLLFSSFSAVDEASELLPPLDCNLLRGLVGIYKWNLITQLFLLSVCVKKLVNFSYI